MSLLITKIIRQKKNNNRYSLMSGEEFIIGLADETMIEFNIHPGMQLSEKTLDKLKKKENIVALKEQAWRFLARREHSTKELSDKLLHKNFSPADVKFIIEDLINKDYLNNTRFARQLINEEITLKRNGPRLIKANLLKKGIDMSVTDELLAEIYPENRQSENCHWLAGKKLNSLVQLEPEKQKKRLADFLNRKGFTWEIISRVIGELI
jgi:regulatory protein